MTFCLGIKIKDGLIALGDTRIVKGDEQLTKSTCYKQLRIQFACDSWRTDGDGLTLAYLAFDATRTTVTDVDFPVDMILFDSQSSQTTYRRFHEEELNPVSRWWSLPNLTDTYLVAMSGYGQLADRKLSKESGFDEHMVKPVDITKLREFFDRLSRD